MAMTETAFYELIKSLQHKYEATEMRFLENVKNQLYKGQNKLDNGIWEAAKRTELRELVEKNKRYLEYVAKQRPEELKKIIEKAYQTGTLEIDNKLKNLSKDGAKVDIPKTSAKSFSQTNELQFMKAVQRTNQLLTNGELTLLRQSAQMYTEAINAGTMAIRAGVETPYQAVNQVLTEWAGKGLPMLLDKRGRNINAESYIKMVLRSEVNATSANASLDRMQELGHDLVISSQHNDESEACRPFSNKIFSLTPGHPKYPYIEDVKFWNRSDGLGLFHPNCRHHIDAYIPGFTNKREEIPEKFKKQEYELTKEQRNIERNIRKYKRIVAVSNDTAAPYYKEKVKEWSIRYDTFVNETDRKRQINNEKIFGQDIRGKKIDVNRENIVRDIQKARINKILGK